MKISRLHDWNVSIGEAREIQEGLRHKISLEPLTRKVELIAGADVAYSKKEGLAFAAVEVFTYPRLERVEGVCRAVKVSFPYVPGFLTFREGPALEAAFKELKYTPDLVIFDGQGIAHPLNMGLAAHMGLWLNCASIGCAKSRLIGSHEEVGPNKGDHVPLVYNRKQIGYVLRSRTKVKPIFVSPGHLLDFDGSLRYAISCLTKYRLPEPVRRAHIEVSRYRNEIIM